MYSRWGKRLFDCAIAASAVVVLSPVMLAAALLVLATLGAPVLHRQQRPGRNGRPFTILKFRTMRVSAVNESDDVRLTAVGRWLRSVSLDELPELLNVLRGEMSLVGPRPLLMLYLDRYSPAQARRHEVRPGITGWAQVNGRNLLSWEDRFALDVWYVDHRSFWLDLRILMITVWKVVRREGISQAGQTTMREFMGSKS